MDKFIIDPPKLDLTDFNFKLSSFRYNLFKNLAAASAQTNYSRRNMTKEDVYEYLNAINNIKHKS